MKTPHGTILVTLASLQHKEATGRRKPGFVAECLRLGKIDTTGKLIEFTIPDRDRIKQTWSQPRTIQIDPLGRDALPRVRLGDAVHAVAGPIGRAIKWPCLKGDGTTDLKPGSPCDRFKKRLNKITL